MNEGKVTLDLETTGMHCASCGKLIEMTLKKEPGVAEVSADHQTQRTVVTYDPALISPTDIAAKIDALGYKAVLPQ